MKNDYVIECIIIPIGSTVAIEHEDSGWWIHGTVPQQADVRCTGRP